MSPDAPIWTLPAEPVIVPTLIVNSNVLAACAITLATLSIVVSTAWFKLSAQASAGLVVPTNGLEVHRSETSDARARGVRFIAAVCDRQMR